MNNIAVDIAKSTIKVKATSGNSGTEGVVKGDVVGEKIRGVDVGVEVDVGD